MKEPKIHYQTALLTSSEDTLLDGQEGGGIVEPGQLLASSGKIAEEKSLDAGEGTQLSSDGLSVISLHHGYPLTTLQKSPSGVPFYLVSIVPLVTVADDRMTVKLTLFPKIKKGTVPDLPVVEDALSRELVVNGIDLARIAKLLSLADTITEPIIGEVIARGLAPIHGEDAYLRFEMEIGPIAGKLLAKGTIDFRERRMFVGVKENQEIATKVPRTIGTDGVDVLGGVIPAKEGTDLHVDVSDEVSYSEVDGSIRATSPGILTVVDGKRIRVSSRQQINGDVDFSTGNIRSQNAVEITGDVKPGFTVSIKGDLSIAGNVYSASINSRGNVVVKGGLLGPDTYLRVKGDADLNYTERSQVVSGGNVVLRSNGYYSTIHAVGNIHCPEGSKIVGGSIIAGGSLTVGQIGSRRSEPTVIMVGTDARRYRYYDELQNQYGQKIQEMKDWYQRYGENHKKDKKIAAILAEIRDLEQNLTSLNLIPRTPEGSLVDKSYLFSEATITVYGLLAARSVIRIGNEIITIKRDLNHVKVSMDKTSGAIGFSSLDERSAEHVC